MSCRLIWLLVESMNGNFRDKLVEAAPGGSRGGAKLTGTGRDVLAAYRDLEAELMRSAKGSASQRLEGLLAEPQKCERTGS